MRILVPTLLVLASLAACGGGDHDEASTTVFKSMGALQCSGGGVSLAALACLPAAGLSHARHKLDAVSLSEAPGKRQHVLLQ